MSDHPPVRAGDPLGHATAPPVKPGSDVSLRILRDAVRHEAERMTDAEIGETLSAREAERESVDACIQVLRDVLTGRHGGGR